MENENYIMLNGKKIPLTDEQVKLIQPDLPEKSPFDRADEGETYYFVDYQFDVERSNEFKTPVDDYTYSSANYCTDENIMKQHALHMLLNNLLWRYSMTHGGDKINWDDIHEIKFFICYDAETDEFECDAHDIYKYFGAVPFDSEETAEAAIEEIVKPFIAEHPDFDLTKM